MLHLAFNIAVAIFCVFGMYSFFVEIGDILWQRAIKKQRKEKGNIGNERPDTDDKKGRG